MPGLIRTTALVLLYVLFFGCGHGTERPPTPSKFDAAREFSSSNPGTTWSYGVIPSPSTPFEVFTIFKTVEGTEPSWSWSREDGSAPAVWLNKSDSEIHPANTTTIPGQALVFHPGEHGERSVLRWTAPLAGSYQVQAKFTGASGYGGSPITTTDIQVLKKGALTSTLYVNVNGGSNEATFAKKLDLEAGDTIDFAVGVGNGSWDYDSTVGEVRID